MFYALLLSLAVQNDCLTEAVDPLEHPQPMQAAGDGLWIGGIGFLPADIEAAEPHYRKTIGQWELELTFSASGQFKFQQAQRCGTGRAIEISYDRRALSRPKLVERILGPKASISGGWRDRASVGALAARIHPGH